MNNSYLENIIFFYVLKHTDLVQAFKSNYFTNPILQQLFDIVKPHVLEYRDMPTELQVINLVRLHGRDDKITDDTIKKLWETKNTVSQYTEEWLNQNTKAFGEWQNLIGGLRRVIEYVKTIQSDVTFENCSDIVQKAKSIFQADTNFTLNTAKGHDFFDPETHSLIELETRTTGYPFIDACLNGGWSNKTLNVFMGSPKVGKSMWLCNLCAKSVLNGEETCYITLELAYQKVSHRIGANILNIPIDQYRAAAADPNFLRARMKEVFNTSLVTPGKFIIEEFPTSTATVYDLESFLLKKEEELSTDTKPFKFKNIFIDYINIMKDAKNPNSENMYLKIKSICEDVRAMAQRNQWCVVSVTQTNRQGYDASDISMSSVSESGGLIATVDSLFGIIQTPTMRVDNVYYIKGVAIRDAAHMGDKKKFNINGTYLRIDEDLTEEILREDMALPGNYGAKPTGNGGYGNKQNTMQQPIPVSSNQPFIQPQLGITEAQISGIDLFK